MVEHVNQFFGALANIGSHLDYLGNLAWQWNNDVFVATWQFAQGLVG